MESNKTTHRETTHREWKKENTLTSPSDRNPEVKFSLDNVPPLTREETMNAKSILLDKTMITNYPEVERRFCDPEMPMQKIFLISFVPSQGATPDDDGFYGFAKVRGTYSNIEDGDKRAEELIREVDSYHKIFYGQVGKPFPITVSSDYSEEINRVDIKKKAKDTISEDIRKKRIQEQKEIEEIKEREQNLLEDVKRTPEENKPDHYTTLKTKKAQLTWTLIETKKKISQMVTSIAKTMVEIDELDESNPELKELFLKKYMDAREKANMPVKEKDKEDTFIKYLVEDYYIPEVEEEYISFKDSLNAKKCNKQ